jgi:hypothetical protein
MPDVEATILSALSSGPESVIPDTYAFSISTNVDHNTVVGSCKSLATDAYVTLTELSTQFYVLSAEADDIIMHGSQEVRVINALLTAASEGGGGGGGLSMSELELVVGKDVCKIGSGIWYMYEE